MEHQSEEHGKRFAERLDEPIPGVTNMETWVHPNEARPN